MRLTFTLLIILLSIPQLFTQQIELEIMANDLVVPVEIAFDQNNIMYVVEKFGTIKKLESNENQIIFIDISDRVNALAGERGLLGMAFDPDFLNNGFFYVHYSGKSDSQTVISRFNSENGLGNPNSEEIIIEVEQPYNNHNGGTITFGPDNYLYIGLGDGGSAGDPLNLSQNPQSLLGKMLRLDVSSLPYQIPSDNPFVNDAEVRDEIWALGLRNPWKFSFDPLNNDLYIADVGQNNWEEINRVSDSAGGENYGWDCYEGFQEFEPSNCMSGTIFTKPIYVYRTEETEDGCSVTGGYVYRGDQIPSLMGKYVYGDWCTGKVWALYKDSNDQWVNDYLLEIDPQELGTFGQDRDGNIYLAALGDGIIYRLNQTSSAIDLNWAHEIIVYPNPVNDYVNLKFEDIQSNLNFEFIDILGNVVLKDSRLSGKDIRIEIKSLERGFYHLVIYQDQRITVKSLLKMD